MGVLSTNALQGIASYKYVSGSYTWLDLQMNHYWNWVVEFLPLWMAPNLITLLGTCSIILSTFLLLYYSPHLEEEAPRWVYVLCGCCVFFYQTFDAIDGKQARRTKSSSPLGQLFDHGCDALCTHLCILSSICAMGVGATEFAYSVVALVGFTFFLAQWEEYHTGTMSCGNGYFGVTEGQFVLIGIHFTTAMYGLEIWNVTFFIPGLTLSDFMFASLYGSNACLALTNFKSVLTGDGTALEHGEQGNKHVSKAAALVQILPVVLILIAGAAWIKGPDASDYAQHPTLYLTSVGMSVVLVASRMIICHMCKIPFSPQFRLLVPYGCLLLNCYAPYLGLSYVTEPPVDPFLASLGFCLCIVLVYLHYMYHVVFEICAYLKIHLLTIRKPRD